MKHPLPLPTLFRVAVFGAAALGALVSLSALQGAIATFVTPQDTDTQLNWLAQLTGDSKAHAAALKASYRAMRTAMASMGVSRVLIALALSGAASAVCVGAIFIRLSMRVAVARLTGGVAFVAAFFRTLAGVQTLIIVQRSAKAATEALTANGLLQDGQGANFTLGVMSTFSVLWTFLIVGTFVLLGNYFRSPAVRKLLEDNQ